MVKRKTPSPKAKKVIIKHIVKDAKKTSHSVREGQKEEVPSGIWPTERRDGRYRSEGGQMTQWAFRRGGSTSRPAPGRQPPTAVGVADDVAAGYPVGAPWRREAAGRLVRHGDTIGARLFVGFPDHRGLIFF